jgi:hypothetical protein
LDFYPCDLLFVHRDAEREPREKRVTEIYKTTEEIGKTVDMPPVVCVIPVRMFEAWLLFDEAAIRHAAGNRSSERSLNLPPLKQLEKLPDPKTELYERLKLASHLTGHRLQRFPVSQRASRVADLIENFSPLRTLAAFKSLEKDIQNFIQNQGWQ